MSNNKVFTARNDNPKMIQANFKRKKVDSDVVLNDTVVIEELRNLEDVIMSPRTLQFRFVLYRHDSVI